MHVRLAATDVFAACHDPASEDDATILALLREPQR